MMGLHDGSQRSVAAHANPPQVCVKRREAPTIKTCCGADPCPEQCPQREKGRDVLQSDCCSGEASLGADKASSVIAEQR